MMVKASFAAFLVAIATVQGFTAHTVCQRRATIQQSMASSSPDALTDYMVKAHEEKLRAVKDAEAKKEAEIKALKAEIDALKSSSPSPSSSALAAPVATVAGSKEELAAKVIAYQQFMSKYIVEAQEQKIKAVQAAETAVKQKYEEKLLLLGASPSAAATATSANAPPPALMSQTQQLYQERNAKVSAAAAAGKSRWGDKEVERVSQGSGVVGAPAAAAVASITPAAPATSVVNGASVPANGVTVVPPEVEAANHGLRSDGSVGGLTLAERVALGASSSGGSDGASLATASPKNVLYQGRNKRVAEAGKASRWGEMEVQRAIQLSGPAAATLNGASDNVAAADHGLRSDGSIGGPSLAERVNLGAQLLGR